MIRVGTPLGKPPSRAGSLWLARVVGGVAVTAREATLSRDHDGIDRVAGGGEGAGALLLHDGAGRRSFLVHPCAGAPEHLGGVRGAVPPLEVFARVERKYGSMDAYLDSIGFDAAQRAELQEAFTCEA